MTALRRLILLLAAAGLAGAWARRRVEPPFPALPPGPPVDAEVVEELEPVFVPEPVADAPEPAPAAPVPAPETPEPAPAPPAPEPQPPEPDLPPPAAGPWPPVPDPQPRLRPLNPEASIAPVEYPTMEMDALSLPVEEGEPRVSAMPPAVGDPIDLAPEGDVIVVVVTRALSVADAVDMALDDYAASPDVEEYAYAAGLMELAPIPGPPEPERPLEDEYALVESAEPDAWQADPGSEAPPEAEEPPAQEPPEAVTEAPPVDIVTVVDDLLDGPA